MQRLLHVLKAAQLNSRNIFLNIHSPLQISLTAAVNGIHVWGWGIRSTKQEVTFNCFGHVHINSKFWQIPHVWYFSCRLSPWREAKTALRHCSHAILGSWPSKAEFWGLGFAPLSFLRVVSFLLSWWGSCWECDPHHWSRQGCASLHLLQSSLKIPPAGQCHLVHSSTTSRNENRAVSKDKWWFSCMPNKSRGPRKPRDNYLIFCYKCDLSRFIIIAI